MVVGAPPLIIVNCKCGDAHHGIYEATRLAIQQRSSSTTTFLLDRWWRRGVLFLADAHVSNDALPDDSTRKSEIEEETNGETGPIISSNDTLIVPEGDTELSTWMELEPFAYFAVGKFFSCTIGR